jgi:hypothetical protein
MELVTLALGRTEQVGEGKETTLWLPAMVNFTLLAVHTAATYNYRELHHA